MERRYQMLLREAGLAAHSLGDGLAAVASYSFAEKGRFYAGMHSLAVGFERLLKVILILDHEISHGQMPDNNDLKNIGHGIKNLISKAREINTSRALGVDEALFEDPLVEEIVAIVHDFAVYARYYNLDSLTSGSRDGDRDPLERWETEVQREIVSRHFKPTKNTRLTEALCEDLHQAGGMSVYHSRGDGTVISDMRSFAQEGIVIGVCQRYGVLYVHSIARFCAQLLDKLEMHLPEASFLSELFVLFRVRDRKAIMRKKRWDPYKL